MMPQQKMSLQQDDTRAHYVREHCAWCWSRRHPNIDYPEEWSSTICSTCWEQQSAMLAARRVSRKAQLGSLPLTCPSSSIHMPKTISPQFAPAVGAGPAWGVGIISYQQVPLALVWDAGSALTTHNQYGWGHKLLWVVATHLQGAVTIHGTNLRTGTPVYPDAEYAEASSTPTALALDPSDPTVVSQDANRDDQWTQFPGGLTVPGAGCYSLEATWPSGSWHLTFAAGLVPSYS